VGAASYLHLDVEGKRCQH